MKISTLMLKGVGFGLLGALVGAGIALPLSLVKSVLLISGDFCIPISFLFDFIWLTTCGLFFIGDTLACCAVGIFLTGAILGWFSILYESRRAMIRQREPRLRWSFLVPMVFVALLFSVYFAQ